MRSGVKALVILGIIIAATAAWFYFHHESDSDASASGDGSGHHSGGSQGGGKSSGPTPIGAATTKIGSIPVYLNGLGNITPRSTVIVHTRVDGQLMRILFREGQLVKENDLLAELDARPYQAQLEEAQGQMIRDEALLAEARIDLQRYQTLFKQDSIAKQQVDTQASLVKQYEGAVRNDKGLIDTANVNLIYTRVTAPVSGRVGLRQVDPGNIVHAADTNGIVIVTQLQPITSIFTIPEDNIPTVMQHTNGGETLDAEAWDRDSKHKLADGTLIAIDNQVDPTTGTVKFRAEFANKDNALFPSQFVNIRLHLDTVENVVIMPAAAVQRGTQGTFVYLVTDNPPPKKKRSEDDPSKDDASASDKPKEEKSADDKSKDDASKDGKSTNAKFVSIQPVTLGPGEGDTVSITKGLASGQVVVVDGADSLKDGAKVQLAALDGKAVSNPDKGSKDSAKDGGGKHHGHKHADKDSSTTQQP